jgi:hypothetical protein
MAFESVVSTLGTVGLWGTHDLLYVRYL